MNKKPLNGDQPATQADLSTLAGEMTTRFDHIDARLDHMDANMATKDDLTAMEQRLDDKFATKDQVATILSLVQSIDQQLKEWWHIPAKVERLHKRAFGTHD